MTFLIQQTLLYAVPLMIVALAGVYAERSGVINLALEGIMIFGAFVGVLFVRLVQQWGWFEAVYQAKNWIGLQSFALMTMAVAALLGALFSLLLAFAAINLKADQTVGGTALNLLAPALVLSAAAGVLFHALYSRFSAKLGVSLQNHVQSTIFDRMIHSQWLGISRYSTGSSI